MAGPTLRTASAEQARAGETLRTTIISQLDAVRQTLSQQASSGIPVGVTFSDPTFRPLLETLFTNARALGIPITGASPQEKFRSLNNWLNSAWRPNATAAERPALTGRNQDSLIDNAAFTEFIWRLNTALVSVNAPGADATVADVSPTLRPPQPASPARPPQPGVSAPGPSVTAPAERPAAPQPVLAEDRRAEYTRMCESLRVIEQYGSDAAQKRTARGYREALDAIMSNSAPTQRQLDDAERQAGRARTLLYASVRDRTPSRALRGAQDRFAAATRGTASASAEASSIASFNTLRQEMQDLSQRGSTPAIRTVATAIVNRLPEIWLLGATVDRVEAGGSVTTRGEGPRWELYRIYEEAAARLRLGTAAGATEAQGLLDTRATPLFAREQAYLTMLAQRDLAVADSLLSRRITSVLPTQSQLRADGRLQTTPARGGRPAVHNGSETIERVLRERADAFRQYLTRNPNQLATDYVLDFYRFSSLYSSTVGHLMDLYSTYQGVQSGLSGTEAARMRTTFMVGYSNAARDLVDPTSSPYDSYPPDVRRIIRREYGRAIGNPGVSEADVREAFRTDPRWRYSSVVNRIYGALSSYAPAAPAEVRSALEARARLRSARIFYEREYLPYIDGTWSDAAHRYQDARFYLENARTLVQGSNLPADVTQPLVALINSWLTNRANPAEPQRAAAADAFVHLAMRVTGLCEAELLLRTPSMRPSSLTDGSATVRAARSIVDDARAELMWDFGHPELDIGLYPNLSRNIFDRAINMLSPRGLQMTDALARQQLILDYEAARQSVMALDTDVETARQRRPADYVEILDQSDPDGRRMLWVPTESALWTASSQDRTAALAAASATEARHLRLLQSQRDNSDLGATSLGRVYAQTPGLSDAMALLDPRIARMRSDRLVEYMWRRLSLDEADKGMARLAGRPRIPRESIINYGHGSLWNEETRQGMLSQDQDMTYLLRGMSGTPATYGQVQLDAALQTIGRVRDAALRQRLERSVRAQYADLRTRVQAISTELGLDPAAPVVDSLRTRMESLAAEQRALGTAATPEARQAELQRQQTEMNRLLLGILDIRIAELDNRLRLGVRLTDGTRISDLARSTDVRHFYVTIAQERLARVRALRAGFAADRSLFSGRVDARQTIMMGEAGIEAIRDEHIGDMTRPILDQFLPVAGAMTSREINGQVWAAFTASIYRAPSTRTTPLTAEEASRMTPLTARQIRDENLAFNWIFYTYVNGNWYIVNPHWGEAGHESEGQFVARVMQVPGGGYAAVSVTRPGERTQATGSVTLEWEPVRDARGNLDVLFDIQGRSGQPPFVPAGTVSGRANTIATIPVASPTESGAITVSIRVPPGDVQAVVVRSR